MSIAHGSNGAITSAGGGNLLPAYPSGISANEYLICGSLAKTSGRSSATPSGFSSLGSETGGAGADGSSDLGTVRAQAFGRVADGSESGTVSLVYSGGAAYASAARIARFTRSAGTGWLVAATTSQLNVGGTAAVSFVFGSDPGIQSGDFVLAYAAFNTDAYNYASHGLTVPGCSVGTGAEIWDSGFTVGTQGRLLLVSFDITSGTSSGAPTFSTTAAGSATDRPAGAAVLIRLREDGIAGNKVPVLMHNYRQRRSA